MNTNLLKYMAFIKTVEYGSFTKAAEVLNCSQSGISRMIHDLEEEWQLTLLERGRARVSLTSEGARLLRHAKNLCEEYQRLQAEVDELHGAQSGLIRIGAISSVATHWLPNIIKAFQKDHPGIDYELLMGDYSEIETWVREGRVDCGFLRLPTRLPLDTIPLAKDRLLAILPEGHPLAARERIPLAALCEEPFLLMERGGKAEIAEIFERERLKPRVHFTTWDDYAIMSMVESGLGLSILPELILRRIPYRIVAKELEVPAYREIGLVLRDRERASTAVKRFLDYLLFRESPLHPEAGA